ncbi:response regulator transcription factor [Cellulomonas sp. HZM]|uniref:response regulator transcription factor n=1 Tax=Cellulomonas sp. HZM TaxID=1454010 RepID=UPI000493089A|nr:response regulator transcription factor [Cellulomonas sp. HZM]
MTRVLVADDDALARRLLATILTAQGFDVVAQVTDGDEVVDAVLAHRPDVVLLDLHMARMDGLATLAELQRLPSPPPVLALTAFGTEETTLAALQAGARGFLSKDADPERIAESVRDVAAGHGALDHAAAAIAITRVADGADHRRDAARDALAALTERELEIARLLPSGLSNAQIGARTFCSDSTVKAHVSSSLTKLGLSTRTELAVLVDRAGWTADVGSGPRG